MQHSWFRPRWLNWLCRLAGRFYAPFFRISCKTFLESLKQTRSSCKSLIYWLNIFIYILLRSLWSAFVQIQNKIILVLYIYFRPQDPRGHIFLVFRITFRYSDVDLFRLHNCLEHHLVVLEDLSYLLIYHKID